MSILSIDGRYFIGEKERFAECQTRQCRPGLGADHHTSVHVLMLRQTAGDLHRRQRKRQPKAPRQTWSRCSRSMGHECLIGEIDQALHDERRTRTHDVSEELQSRVP